MLRGLGSPSTDYKHQHHHHDVIAGAAKGGDRSADRVPVADPSGGALVPPRPQQRRRPEDPRHAQRRRVRYLTLPALKSLCCGSRGCRKFRHTYLLILNSAISLEDKTDIESVNIKLSVFFLQFDYAISILPITQSVLLD